MSATQVSARLILAAVALVIAQLIAAPAASAHSQLLETAPVAESIVTAPFDEVTLTFNEPVRGRFSTVVVTGPGDRSYSDAGVLRVIDNVVHQPVAGVRSGPYRVAWRVVSADGHPVSGEFAFRVALPGKLEPTGPLLVRGDAGAPPASGAGGGRAWWWVVAAIVVAMFVLALFRWRRPRGDR